MAGINNYVGVLKDIVRGNTIRFLIKVRNDDGSIVDITGGKVYLTLSSKLDPTFTPELEILIDPPTNPIYGETEIVVTDTQTFNLTKGSYYYSIRYINDIGETKILDMGRIKVLEAVSGRIE